MWFTKLLEVATERLCKDVAIAASAEMSVFADLENNTISFT